MGHVLDVVPNHMGIARSANPWWMDVLENGPSSRYARFFDIEWQPVKDELADKVLIPILGDYYGVGARGAGAHPRVSRRRVRRALRRRLAADRAGHLSAHSADEALSAWTRQRGRPGRTAEHHDRRREPAAAHRARSERDRRSARARRRSSSGGSPRSSSRSDGARRRDRPDAGGLQRHRAASRDRSIGWMRCSASSRTGLSDWHVASEEINYRRFFDVNQLAALRMEDPVVFDEVHRFILELLARGAPTGLRDRSRRRSVRARRLPAAAAGAGGRSAARLPTPAGARSTWWSRRFSGRTNSCQPTGPCTARPATNSPAS